MHPDLVKLQLLGVNTWLGPSSHLWFAHYGERPEPNWVATMWVRDVHENLIYATTEEELARMVIEEITRGVT